MADLLTHAAVGQLLGRWHRDRDVALLFVLGNFLPDLGYKSMLMLASAPTWYCEPTHTPLWSALLCYAVAMMFEEPARPRAFACLWLGSLVHIAIDLGKDYLGSGVVLLAFPFSLERYELGLYTNDLIVYAILPALVTIGIVELLARKVAKR